MHNSYKRHSGTLFSYGIYACACVRAAAIHFVTPITAVSCTFSCRLFGAASNALLLFIEILCISARRLFCISFAVLPLHFKCYWHCRTYECLMSLNPPRLHLYATMRIWRHMYICACVCVRVCRSHLCSPLFMYFITFVYC